MIILLAIGKTVLILFLVLICILAVVFLMPISYELDVDIDEKRVDVRVNWLFKLVRFRFHLKERLEAALFILFFKRDFTDPEARKKRAAKKQKKLQRQERKRKRKLKRQRKDFEKKRTVTPRPQEKQADSGIHEPAEEFQTSQETGQETDQEAAPGVKRSLGKLLEAAGNVFGYVNVFRRILGLVREYEIISLVWPKLSRFLGRIRPRKMRGRIVFGLEDPAATGQLTGVIAMIPLFYQTEIRISPDFETDETYIRGNIYIKGHMLLIHAVILIVGLVREKKIRSFIGAVRKRK